MTVRNILGDRGIEWDFVKRHLPAGPGRCLDFGPGGSHLSAYAAGLSWHVVALDRDASDWSNQPGVVFVHADLFEVDWGPAVKFNVVINCSTIEHVGIPGRYGVTEARPDGDLEAMRILRDWLEPGGVMLLTIPLGRDAVFAPMCRVYGTERLPRLLDGFGVEVEEYYVKNESNRWAACQRDTALDEVASVESQSAAGNLYALGCFMLRKS